MRKRLLGLELKTLHGRLEGEVPWVLSTMNEATINCAKLVRKYESEAIIHGAETWGIEIQSKPDWYETDQVTGFGIQDALKNIDQKRRITFLSEKGFTMITKQIREARFAYWKGWAGILIPILSLIVAILALLKR